MNGAYYSNFLLERPEIFMLDRRRRETISFDCPLILYTAKDNSYDKFMKNSRAMHHLLESELQLEPFYRKISGDGER